MSESTDGLELDTVDVYTRAHLRELGILYPVPLRVDERRVDGVVIEVGFLTFASLAEFLDYMNPRRVTFHVAQSEDKSTIEQLFADVGAAGALH